MTPEQEAEIIRRYNHPIERVLLMQEIADDIGAVKDDISTVMEDVAELTAQRDALVAGLVEIHALARHHRETTEKAWEAEGGEPMGPFYQTVCTAAHGFGEILRKAIEVNAASGKKAAP